MVGFGRWVGLVVAVSWLAFAAPALAQAPAISVEQGYGFASVRWSAVAGATEYEIERAAAGSTDPGVVVGRWLPTRYRPSGKLTFADSGFVLGDAYRWRVRALVGGAPGAWSGPVTQSTQAQIGPPAYLTGFERSDATAFTSHADEVALSRRSAATASAPRSRPSDGHSRPSGAAGDGEHVRP